MCTLTVVPLPGRVRLAFNRDESRTRLAGLSPEVRWVGTRRAVLPTDPVSGGTWLAVNDGGLALAVLNVNPPAAFLPSPLGGEGPGVRGEWLTQVGSTLSSEEALPLTPNPSPPRGEGNRGRSRGEIIPALLPCDSPADALTVFEQTFAYTEFAPFRLVLIGCGLLAEVRWDGREPMVMSRLLGGTPLLFTSSGLGDHLVESVRRELFGTFFDSPAAEWPQVQDAFHRHQWPGREHLSVNMARASAVTVSHAVVELGDDAATVRYFAEPFDPATETVATLPFVAAGVP